MRGAPRRRVATLVAVVVAVLAAVVVAGSPPAAAERATLSVMSQRTGLTVTMDDIAPATFTPGSRFRISGSVQSEAARIWLDAQVYLTVSSVPATSKAGLDAAGLGSGEDFGTRVVTFGLFDEIGAVRPGQKKDYQLSIPFADLPISGASGAYHVGVVVVAGTPQGTRQTAAITDTVVPYLNEATPHLPRTRVVTLLAVTAPVARQPDGTFADDQLAVDLSFAGRLRNLLDFALQAPAGSLHLMLDPALDAALRAMRNGYQVQSLSARAEGDPVRTGQGQQEAAAWLADLATVSRRQEVSLLPWGNPSTSGLAEAQLPAVVEAANLASRRYASDNDLDRSIVDWQTNGSTTRRGLTVSNSTGASVHVVSQASLTRLPGVGRTGYPAPFVSVATQRGPLSVVVTRSDLAGGTFTADLDATQFRERLAAEALVRSLSAARSTTMVVAAPFHWDPGNLAVSTDVTSGYLFPTITPITLGELQQRKPRSYTGPVQQTDHQPDLPGDLLQATRRLRDEGRILSDLLSDGEQALITFEQRLALAGSSAWPWQPRRAEALTRHTTRSMAEQIRQVTVTGPAFVALSGSSGSFPLTVSNGLDVSVQVRVQVMPDNPELDIDDIATLELGPGQTRDVEVVTHSEGSGLTQVRARLTTPTDRAFGRPWAFDIRATQIGVAIWVVMAVLLAALFGAAAVRIFRRVRAHEFRPRGETSL